MSDAGAGKHTSAHGEDCRDTSAIVAARLRIIDKLAASAVREWGAGVNALPHGAYVQMLLCLAADRIYEGETRGFARRKPAQPAALDVTKLQIGLE